MKQVAKFIPLALAITAQSQALEAPNHAADPAPAQAQAEVGNQRPYLGIYMTPMLPTLKAHLPEDQHGVVVAGVAKDSPAAKAGISNDDIITKIDGKRVFDSDELADAVAAKSPDDQVEIEYVTKGKLKTTKADLAPAPDGFNRFARRGFFQWGQLDANELNKLKEIQELPGGFGMLQMVPAEQLQNFQVEIDRLMEDLEFRLGDLDIAGAAGQIPNLEGAEIEINGKKLRMPKLQQLNDLRLGGGEAKAGALELGAGNLRMGQGLQLRIENGKTTQTRTLSDNQGTVQLRQIDDELMLFMYDNEGELLFEGPFNEAGDLEAIPDEQLNRIHQLQLKPGSNNLNQIEGLKLFQR